MKTRFLLRIASLLCFGGIASAGSHLEITGDVLLEEIWPVGLNVSGPNFYDSTFLVQPVATGFDTRFWRRNFNFTSNDGKTLELRGVQFFGQRDVAPLLKNGRYVLLSGPEIWREGRITKVDYGENHLRIELDRPVPSTQGVDSGDGIMLEYADPSFTLDAGNFRGATVAAGEGHPGGPGNDALLIPAGGTMSIPLTRGSRGYAAGKWRIEAVLRAPGGKPEDIAIGFGGQDAPVNPRAVRVGAEWEPVDLTFDVAEQEAKDNYLFVVFKAGTRPVYLDNLRISRPDDPAVGIFHKEFAETLKLLRPGILRYLQMQGSWVENDIAPRMRAFGTPRPKPVGMHDFLALCRYVGCDPWFTLPTTLDRKDIETLMEYLGAPAEIGAGKIRAAAGQQKPWTEVFRHIHIEPGNEVWNPGGYGGYVGRDYWNALFELVRASKYYQPSLVCHAGIQESNNWLNQRVIKWADQADYFTVAGYYLGVLDRAQEAKYFKDPTDLARYAFGLLEERFKSPKGSLVVTAELAAGKPLSVYEVNMHLSKGDHSPALGRALQASVTGAVTLAGNLLMAMDVTDARYQCVFNSNQIIYGAPKDGAKDVRLMGVNLDWRAATRRFRPTGLALAALNPMLDDLEGGQMLAVRISDNPVYRVVAPAESKKKNKDAQNLPEAGGDDPGRTLAAPALKSYAFRKGAARGLVILNQEIARPLEVTLGLDAPAAGAKATATWLAADRWDAENELDNPRSPTPEVELKTESLADFHPGRALTMPPHSMVVLRWETQAK